VIIAMTPFAENTHAFVVRIWREPREISGAKPEWRGVIEHVPSGKRRYMNMLDEIVTFIALYAPDMQQNANTTNLSSEGTTKRRAGHRKRRSPKT